MVLTYTLVELIYLVLDHIFFLVLLEDAQFGHFDHRCVLLLFNGRCV